MTLGTSATFLSTKGLASFACSYLHGGVEHFDGAWVCDLRKFLLGESNLHTEIRDLGLEFRPPIRDLALQDCLLLFPDASGGLVAGSPLLSS
jgi:hypothetical protein